MALLDGSEYLTRTNGIKLLFYTFLRLFAALLCAFGAQSSLYPYAYFLRLRRDNAHPTLNFPQNRTPTLNSGPTPPPQGGVKVSCQILPKGPMQTHSQVS